MEFLSTLCDSVYFRYHLKVMLASTPPCSDPWLLRDLQGKDYRYHYQPK